MKISWHACELALLVAVWDTLPYDAMMLLYFLLLHYYV